LANLSMITVNRCVRPACFGDLKTTELHNFADASQVAYGAVSYLRLMDVEERIYCAFLIGKSRLASLRPMTVPRLELSAAVLAVQLDQTVREQLDIPISQSTFWSDSTCVLQYIRIFIFLMLFRGDRCGDFSSVFNPSLDSRNRLHFR